MLKDQLTYTVIGSDSTREYRGFCRCNSLSPPDAAVWMVACMNEGEIELWWLDKNKAEALDQLRRYYIAEQPWVNASDIVVLRKF